MHDAWDPAVYDRFKEERAAPFRDLLALIEPVPGGRAVDLGCGTGDLTAELVAATGITSCTGIDNSPTMLARAAAHARPPSLAFVEGDLGAWAEPGACDLVVANASLQWVPDHPAVLRRWVGSLKPGGQLAVQVPYNHEHASHRAATAVSFMEQFLPLFPAGPPPDPVAVNCLAPERYALLLNELGLEDVHVRMQVYLHRLEGVEDLVDWAQGTTLTRFRRVLDDEAFEDFVYWYRERLLETEGQRRPYWYPFKRILLWGRAPRG
jgi:trans-aconitate 2-methyltransferase